MEIYVTDQVIKLMIKKGKKIGSSQVLVLGITFKENCPNIRNSKVSDIIREFQDFDCKEEIKQEYNLDLKENPNFDEYEAIVLAIEHNKYKNIKFDDNDKQP